MGKTSVNLLNAEEKWMQIYAEDRSHPLSDGRATFETSDLAEGMHYVSETSRHLLYATRSSSPMTLRHWGLSLEHVRLDLIELSCGQAFRTEKTDQASYYYFQLPLGGICELEAGNFRGQARPGEAFALNPGQDACKKWIGDCRQLMIRVDHHALAHTLSSALDRDCREPILFENSVQDGQASLALRSLALSVWQNLALLNQAQQWRIGGTLERSLLMACLGLLRNNYSSDLLAPRSPVAPYYVRRAEEYIRANMREPIGIEDMVAVSGVSSRSLYYGFRRWRGTTPMSFLRNLRLSVAHDELRSASGNGERVTHIALNIGYDHLSRFSRDYKRRFGESPSETMRKAN